MRKGCGQVHVISGYGTCDLWADARDLWVNYAADHTVLGQMEAIDKAVVAAARSDAGGVSIGAIVQGLAGSVTATTNPYRRGVSIGAIVQGISIVTHATFNKT